MSRDVPACWQNTLHTHTYIRGEKGDRDFHISDLVKNPHGTDISVKLAQLAKSTLLTTTLVPPESFKMCSDAKERVGCGKQREVTAPIHPWKIVALVPALAVKDLPLGRTLMMIYVHNI